MAAPPHAVTTWRHTVARQQGRLGIAATADEYSAARDAGAREVLRSVQAGNALDARRATTLACLRVTLVHLTNSNMPPDDLKSGDSYPRLVQEILDRRWSAQPTEKILGRNFPRLGATRTAERKTTWPKRHRTVGVAK